MRRLISALTSRVFERSELVRHASTVVVCLPLIIIVLSMLKIIAEPATSRTVQTRVYSSILPQLSPDVQYWLGRQTAEGRQFDALARNWSEYIKHAPLPPATYNSDRRMMEKLIEAGKAWSVAPELGYGIIRRLDDASFWTLVATVVAITAIFAIKRPSVPLPAPRWIRCFAGVMAFALTAVYVHRVFVTNGTFFWWRGDVGRDYGQAWGTNPRAWLVIIEQLGEGVVYLAMVLYACSAFVVGWRTVRAVSTAAVQDAELAASVAGPVISCCVSPFALLFVVFTVFKVVGAEAGFVNEPGLWFAVNVLGQFSLVALPFVLLAVAAIWQWRGVFLYTLEIGKGLVRVVALPRDQG